MAQKGFLVIADITGYSAYLNESELEHARDSLSDLLDVLVKHIRAPLVVAKLEGDAVFAHAPEGGFREGQTLLEMIESVYVAYRKALNLMVINTTCTCNACRNLPNLDLKFFIHHGTFSTQRVGDFQELVGSDVNLVHRLVKNRIIEETGLEAYAAYTQTVFDALDRRDLTAGLIPHRETFDDVGEVQLYIQDMHGAWEAREGEMRVVVKPEEAMSTREAEYQVPPLVLWEYVTRPETRKLIMNADAMTIDQQAGGRTGVGAAYVCAHGDSEIVHTVVDWHPFEEYTFLQSVPGGTMLSTFRLFPTEEGTRLQCLAGQPEAPLPMRLVNKIMFRLMVGTIEKGLITLREQIEKDMEAREAAPFPKIEISGEEIEKAATESLKIGAGG